MKLCSCLLYITLKLVECSLYDGDQNVLSLKSDEFLNRVKKNGVSIVEFYADWCAHCKDFSKVYKDVAKVLKDVIPVIAVDDEALARKYNVQGFPTVKIFVGNGYDDPTVVDYNENRTLDALVTFAMKKLNKYVKDKVSKLTGQSEARSKASKPKGSGGSQASGTVIQLTSSNFNTVLDDKYNQWLIMFYAPWCGHCKQLEPEWTRMANVAEKVKVGRVDCTVETALASDYNIKGYPTIKLFPQGDKSKLKVMDYNGQRNAEDILAFARKYYKNMGPPIMVNNLQDLKKQCGGPLCLLFFLPSESKDNYLSIISKAMERNSNSPFSFCYTLANDHKQWEQVFGLSNFPALLGLNLTKGVFLHMKTSFDEDSISGFINSIMTGRAYAERLTQELTEEGTLSNDEL